MSDADAYNERKPPRESAAPLPTLCRWVQYRLGNGEWIAAVVVDEEGATPDLAVELELHPSSRLSIVHDANRSTLHGPCVPFLFQTATGLVAHSVKRGDAPGEWRWPPKTT